MKVSGMTNATLTPNAYTAAGRSLTPLYTQVCMAAPYRSPPLKTIATTWSSESPKIEHIMELKGRNRQHERFELWHGYEIHVDRTKLSKYALSSIKVLGS